MAAPVHVDVGGLLRPPGDLDAADALAPYRGTLTHRMAAHLLRRAGFGGTPQEVERLAGVPVPQAVAALIRVPSASAAASPQLYDRRGALGQLRSLRGDRKAFIAFLRGIIHSEMASIADLRLWWLDRMLTTPAPLQEKMTLYFHGHFTSFVQYATLTYQQNQLFRSYALGNLRQLMHDVSKDAAMLLYLNNNTNVKAHPNENFARESMELFTLGVGHYTEQDVRESARAWTGWRFNKVTQAVSFDPRLHDDGSKTFLGQTGSFDGDDIVDLIFAQPQCARFFATSLLDYFVYNDPEPHLIDGVAALLRRHDYELAPVLASMFASNVFYSKRAYRALVKSPAEFVVGTYKTLGLPRMDRSAVGAMGEMGQVLFHPPNVAGWAGGGNWLSSGTMIARQNFLARIANSQTLERSSWLRDVPMNPRAATEQIVAAVLHDDAAPAARFELEGQLAGAGTSALTALSPENFGQRISEATSLAMAMPAYQLN